MEKWKAEMPTEAEMRPKDKYTFFDKKEKGFRKGVHGEFSLRLALVEWRSSERREGMGLRLTP